MNLPWRLAPLRDWWIVGMNHYRQAGRRCLYVAMTRDGRCISAEGDNEEEVFRSLANQAMRVNGDLDRARQDVAAASRKAAAAPEMRNWETDMRINPHADPFGEGA